ncbi:MAG: hypothetical protein ACPG5B_06585 [Chitinophagales bacterium]
MKQSNFMRFSIQINIILLYLFLSTSLNGQNEAPPPSLGFTSAILCDNGTMQTWGAFYSLGYNSGGDNPLPMTIPNFDNIVDFATGHSHMVAVRCDGTI